MKNTVDTTENPRPRRRLPGRRLVAGALIGTIAVSGAAASVPSGGAKAPPSQALADTTGSAPHPKRVAVLALENKSYGQVIGSPKAPYINRLAKHSALATHYYAVDHPSLPNYIALTGGSKFEIAHNCTACDTSAPNLVSQLNGKGIAWKAYFEGLTSSKRPGPVTSRYNPHYNPFVYYDSVRGKVANRSRIVGFSHLNRDLKRGQLPRFSWIAPGVRHDGHNSSLRQSDRYASHLVPRVLHALGPNGVLYLTWDEGAHNDRSGVARTHGGGRTARITPGGGHVALIAAGGAAKHATRVATPANHYSLLRTIEANFGLPALGQAGSPTTPVLSGLLKR